MLGIHISVNYILYMCVYRQVDKYVKSYLQYIDVLVIKIICPIVGAFVWAY